MSQRSAALVRILTGLLLATVPFATALVAIDLAPAAHVEIAGQQVSVRPVIGQDTSRLFDGALIRPQHAEIAGKAVGVDVNADWNKLVPTDKTTRGYLVSLWENPTPAIHLITVAARRQLLVWGLGGFLVGLLAVAAVVTLSWQRRRRLAGYEPGDAALVTRHNRRLRRSLVAAGVAVALALDVLAVRVWSHDDHQDLDATAALDGTPLEGTQVTGLLADVLPFLSVLRPRSAFYDKASRNLERALADRPDLAPREGEVVLVVADDLEDVNGMARQVGLTAHLVGADGVVMTGDLTFAGKSVETYLLDTIDYYSEDVPVFLTPGLHDTSTILEAARARHWKVADGQVQDLDGLTLLPLADPRVSTVGDFGSGDVLRDPAIDVDTFVADAIELTCADHPDLVLLHDHLLGRLVAESGCARIGVVDGRSYDFLGAQPVETASRTTAAELTLGSAGGHVSTEPDPGIITHPARFAIVYADHDRGVARYAVVTVQPDATVEVGRPGPFGPQQTLTSTAGRQ